MTKEYPHLLSHLKIGDKEAFSKIFVQYYKDLVIFAGNFIKEREHCEDIVQTVFFKLWEKREEIEITSSLRPFLLQSVKNGCMDEIRHLQVAEEHDSHIRWVSSVLEWDVDNYILYSEIESHLEAAIAKLPPSCKEAFTLNRFEGMKYKQIAKKLSISERSVEARIGKAIQLLRLYLKEFLILILYFFEKIGQY
jgi:RNA polymerase sigma-70 factor (ECF subfamily)